MRQKQECLEHIRTLPFTDYLIIFICLEPTTPENAILNIKLLPQRYFDAINKDIDFAIEQLPWITSEIGRWTKASAKHLKAKVALWQSYDSETQAEDLDVDSFTNEPHTVRGTYQLWALRLGSSF